MNKMKYRHMMHRLIHKGSAPLLVGVLVILAFAGHGQCEAPNTPMTLTEKQVSLGKAPQNSKMYGITVNTPEATHLAYATRVNGKMAVHVNGVKGPDFGSIAKGTPIFGPINGRVAYIVYENHKAFTVVDGEKGPAFDGISHFAFSPDGTSWTCRVQNGKKQAVVTNGNQGEAFDFILGQPLFSPDSKRIAVFVTDGDKRFAVVGKKKFGPYDEVKALAFSPDSRHVAFAARKGSAWHLVTDGQKGADDNIPKGYENISAITWSPDSAHLAYVAQANKRLLIVEDHREHNAYQSVSAPLFSPDSRHLAYPAQKGKKWVVVADGHEGPDFDQLGPSVYSADSSRLAYVGINHDRPVVVINGKKGRKYDSVGMPVFSPDGQHLAYRARKKKNWFIVYDGKPGKAYVDAKRPKFGPDSSKMAYMATRQDNKMVMVVNGTEHPPFDAIGRPYFSPSGKNLAYTVLVGDQWGISANRVVTKHKFTGFLKGIPLVFDSDTRLHGLAIKDKTETEFFRIEVGIEKKG